MNIKTFEKAFSLRSDVTQINTVIGTVEKEHAHPTIITSQYTGAYFSDRFERELIEWMKSKAEEYQKEFDDLE